MTTALRPRRREFPGWHMVWTLSATCTVAYGVLFYAFAVFVVPMREDLGATTGQLSGALSLAIAVNGLAAIWVGKHLDRYGTRWLMTGGSLLGASSVVTWSQAQDLAQLYLAFVGIGLAGAAVMYEPAFALVTTWFDRDRSAALLTLTVVAGFASTIFLPLSQALVDGIGWREALLVLAAMVAGQAVGVAALLTLPRTAGVAVFVVLFGAGFGVMTIARPWLLGRYVPVRVFGSVSGRQSLATGLGRVVAPVTAGALITSSGYPPALLAVAACALAAAALLVAAERAHV